MSIGVMSARGVMSERLGVGRTLEAVCVTAGFVEQQDMGGGGCSVFVYDMESLLG